MCGIVAAIGSDDIVSILLQGLQRMEYRGYDSCGLAIHDGVALRRARSTARVAQLQHQVDEEGLRATLGIAHTRWATHGAPKIDNAHPHFSMGPNAAGIAQIAVVHNGIIENHDELRSQLQSRGYIFTSQTDTEVLAHLIDAHYRTDLRVAVVQALSQVRGAYAIAVMCRAEPARFVAARAGSPLVLGLGKTDGKSDTTPTARAIYLASDAMALAGVTDQIIYLEEGDVVDARLGQYELHDAQGKVLSPQDRPIKTVTVHSGAAELGAYRHYMQKEIFEQPEALANTLEGIDHITPALFGETAQSTFDQVESLLLLACGTSYYSACTAKYWLEAMAGIPTQVEIASEYRYRTSVSHPKTLVVCISQSGETADTLAALRHAQSLGMGHTLTICNVPTSAMVRECKHAYITRAGVEIGVASTKAFTTQLAGLFLLTLVLAQAKGRLSEAQQAQHLKAMRHLPVAVQAVLALEPQVMSWADQFARVENALFLGRGLHYPVALEGALKLKEISYIHAEAYPAGELKHGPLALVTQAMPVVVVAPNDRLLDKLKSNMQEVRARGGVLYVLADADSRIFSEEGLHVIRMPEHYGALSPILHTVPLQLLAYHTACARGTDVDKPRNLAKSVTVE